MKIHEWITGTPDERAAVKGEKALGQKEKLTKRDQTALDYFRSKTKALAMRQMGTAVAAAVAIATPLALMQYGEMQQEAQVAREKARSPSHELRNDAVQLPEAYLPQMEAIKNFKEGLALVLSLTDEDKKYLTPQEQAMVADVKRIYEQEVTWMTMSGTTYFAAEQSIWKKSGIATVPEGHRVNAENSSAFTQKKEPDGLEVIQAKSVDISKVWAGMFLGHELIHLDDRKSGREQQPAVTQEFLEGEVRAFELERVLAKKMSQGKFAPAVSEAVREYQITTLLDWANLRTNFAQNHGGQIAEKISMTLGGEKPKSRTEDSLRNAFLSVAIGFQLIEKELYGEQQQKAKVELMRIMYKEYIKGLR